MTSKFNGYFNANELLEESVATLESQHVDNYNEILPIYEYRAATRPEAVAQNLDEAIKKVSVVATLHEGSHWVDDCYLLIGKSQYLKQDFEAAQNALEFFMDEFNPDGSRINARPSKKSKTKSKRPSSKRTNSAKTEKQKRREAKIAEKERKAYNKQVRKNKKKGTNRTAPAKKDGTGTEIVATKRNTKPDPDPPPQEPVRETAPETPGSLQHKPCYQEAQLWLAKTHIERENFPRVEFFLNSLKNTPGLQEDVARELPVAWAYYSVVRGNYKGAIPHLKNAIELAKKRPEKARYAFILGQIAEKENLAIEARDYFAMTKDLKPDYELRFNAELSMARTALLTGEANEAQVVASLEKMLKDDKNEEYKDQIYFTLGKLALQAGNTDEAIRQLILSVEHGGQNTAQATESNYLLAVLYYEKGDYVNAKSSYDAALGTMAKSDERYKPTERLAKNLTDIARHLTQIALQDSLLEISNMSAEEQEKLAKELLAAQRASSKDNMNSNLPTPNSGKNASGRGMATNGQFSTPPARPASNLGNTQASAFFAYDDRAVRRGKREFEREWGERPLADNWRLSSKIQNISPISEIEDATNEVEEVTEADLKRVLKGVPSSEEEVAAAHKAIQNAMLQLGSLYRDKLEDYEQSTDMLEDLLAKYPDTEYRLDAYYQLYLSYLSLDDITQANKYKDLILKEFSASKYALALSDPDYIKKQISEEQKIDVFYQEVFELVEQHNYEEARQRIEKAKELFGTNHPLQPKFSLLEAMTVGNLEGRDAYISALKTIIGNYPNTPEEIKARDMLLQLGEYKGSRLNLSKGKNLSGPNFKVAPDAIHFFLVMIENQGKEDGQIGSQEAKIAISNYNRKYHQLDRLKISSLVFDPKTKKALILVRSFKSSERAMKYYDNVGKNKSEFLPENAVFDAYPVTQHNYREIIRQKSLEDYKEFFRENYEDN